MAANLQLFPLVSYSTVSVETDNLPANRETEGEGTICEQKSPIETLPLEVLFLVFKHIRDDSSLARTRQTSITMCACVDAFLNFKEGQYKIIASTLPRSLTHSEMSEPLLKRLEIVRGIINSYDKIGRTPLIKASIAASMDKNEFRMVKRLMFLGADPQMKVKSGWTVTDFTAFWNFNEVDDFIRKEARKYLQDRNELPQEAS